MTVTINGTTGYSGPVGTIGDLTTTGNTTLGDASGDTLTINGSTTTLTQGTANGVAYLNGSKVLTTGTALVFDGSNLGVGVTPSAWKSNYKAQQTGNAAAIVGRTDNNNNYFSSNWYVNSSNQDIYQNTGYATLYSQGTGVHAWYNAPSGTAGNAISFTQAMTLDASGNLGIGSTSPAALLHILSGSQEQIRLGRTTTGSSGYITFFANNSSSAQVQYAGILGDVVSSTAGSHGGALLFYTTGSGTSAERARINSSGNLLVGTTSDVKNWNNSLIKMRVENGIQFGTYSCIAEDLFDVDSLGICVDSSENLCFGQYNTVGGSYTERARIDSSGNLLVGTTTAGGKVAAFSNAADIFSANSTTGKTGYYYGAGQSTGTAAYFTTTSGQAGLISVSGNTTAFTSGSDYRLKDNIRPLTGALAKLAAFKPVAFEWKSDGSYGESFVAHELAEVCPQAVTGEKDAVNEDGSIKPQSIDTSFLVATLTAAIQELKAEFDAYKLTHP